MAGLSRVTTLGGLLRRIGSYDPACFKERFEARLILQKTIYLMQAYGLNLGYSYSWYLRGPYSVGLSKDAYELSGKYEQTPLVRFASDKDEDRFRQFLLLMKGRENDDRWLEVTGSIHFLDATLSIGTKEGIYKEMTRKMTDLSRAEFEESWKFLKRNELLRKTE